MTDLICVRVENITAHIKVIEATLQQLRQAEQAARTELSTTAITLSELRISNEAQQKKIEELELLLQQKTDELQKYQDRIQELKDRCNTFSTTSDEERTRR